MEGFGPKGSEKPLGLASEETEAHEGTAVTSASSPCEQGANEGWGVEGLGGEGATGEPQESGCDSKPHHADDLIIPGAHFYPPVPL